MTETGYMIRYRKASGGPPFYLHFPRGEEDPRKGCVLGCHNKNVCIETFREWLCAMSYADQESFLTENIIAVMKVEVVEEIGEVLNLPGEIEFKVST
jgi:hypothetical protein